MLIKSVKIPEGQNLTKKDILIDDKGIIIKIADNIEVCNENINGTIKESIIEGKDNIAIPGFIDVHTHGYNGHDSEEICDGLKEMAKKYAERGTLGFCPTIGPRPLKKYLEIIDEYKKAFSGQYLGARFLGLHLEGPYLNPKKPGAIPPESMYDIDLRELEEFLKLSEGYVKLMSIAPEIKGATEAIKLLNKYGVIASAGHTLADYDEMQLGIEAGITHATHTYNAMKDFSHRKAGILEAIWLNDNVYSELVADGVHVSKPAIEVLIRLKGKNKVMAISDGGKSCGIIYEDGHQFPDGFYIKNGAVYTPSNILCGSTKDVYEHFKFFIKEMNYSFVEAIKLTSTNASINLGFDFGEIAEGKKANLLLINEELNIQHIIINGEIYN